MWQAFKSLPTGLRVHGPAVEVSASEIAVLADITAVDAQGNELVQQEIFDRMLARIKAAKKLVLLDNFFFNTITGSKDPPYRRLCDELTTALISAKTSHPEMPVVVITDPINTVYGGHRPPHLDALRQAGVRVIITDLKRLRDSNSFYSAWWRVGPRWFGTPTNGGILPNPFTANGPQVGFRSWFSLLNFKANHRKVLLTDDGQGQWNVIIGSLNAHDGSSKHSNLAVEVKSTNLARQVLDSEVAVIEMSGQSSDLSPISILPASGVDELCHVTLVTEGAILDAILSGLSDAGKGDTVDGAFFYLSHRRIRRALLDAAERGTEIRLILDPSKDAFGRTKNGIPNRQAAFDLVTHGKGRITIRWYDTHGEQFHPKVMVINRPTESTIIGGSGNLTRRNLDDLNLESDLIIRCLRGSSPEAGFRHWFDTLWFNDGLQATVNYEVYQDPSLLRRVIADLQERTGMGTF